MSLISVRVKREGAAHHQDGKIYKTGETFKMEESVFEEADKSIHGFFERADAPLEQIKTKDLPAGEPLKGAAVPAVQEPKPPQKPAEGDNPSDKDKKKLELKKK